MIKDKKNMKKRWKRIISNMIAIALVIISSIPTISIPVKAAASVVFRTKCLGWSYPSLEVGDFSLSI